MQYLDVPCFCFFSQASFFLKGHKKKKEQILFYNLVFINISIFKFKKAKVFFDYAVNFCFVNEMNDDY